MIQFDLRFFLFKIGGQKPPTTESPSEFKVSPEFRQTKRWFFSMANQPTRPKEPPSEIRGLIRH